jgi:DNA polymerase-3 subunit chi
MSRVSFYLLDVEADKSSSQPAHLVLACQLAARCFRSKQRCLVFCQDKALAEQFDELLWQLPNDSFVPHNLVGEGPVGGAPVEISWQIPAQFNRPVLINLALNMPEFHQRFGQIYDFVPAQEQLKQQARDRYKYYRAAGHQLDTLPASSINEI